MQAVCLDEESLQGIFPSNVGDQLIEQLTPTNNAKTVLENVSNFVFEIILGHKVYFLDDNMCMLIIGGLSYRSL